MTTTTTTNNHLTLIGQVGGIDTAKSMLKRAKAKNLTKISYQIMVGNVQCTTGVFVDDLEEAIAQYDQLFGISKEFKVGEKIVYRNLSHERLFYIKAVLTDSIVIHECLGEADAKCFSEFHPYSDIRHATPAEIKVGHRLDHSENVTDMVTDIRNHISPNTKVINHG